MPKTPEEIRQSCDASMEAKMGVSLADWLALIRPFVQCSPRKCGEIVHWLESEHGLEHGYAALLAHDALRRDAEHSIMIP